MSAEREGDLSLSLPPRPLSVGPWLWQIRAGEEARWWVGWGMRCDRTGDGYPLAGQDEEVGTWGDGGERGKNADGGWIGGKDFEMSECATTLVELAGRAITAIGRLGLGLIAVGMRAVGPSPGEAFLS